MAAQKIVISFWLLVISLFLTPFTAFAQTSSPTSKESKPFFEVSQTVPLPTTVSPTSPIYTDLLVHNMFHTFSCLAVGQSAIGQPCLTYQITQNAQGAIQGIPVLSQANLSGGVLGTTTSLIGALYDNRPVRTSDYLASLGEGLGIVKEASAQVVGSGAKVLNPILTLWQVSRNISYVIMIIIFVIIGLMVMFRQRINPQTVITAQAAIPGLVIGLILITFSYFLAGLISDTAFIGTNLVGYYFVAAQPAPPPGTTTTCPNPANLVECAKAENVLNIFSRFSGIIDKDNAANALSTVWAELNGSAKFVLTSLAVFLTAQTTAQGLEFLKAIPTFGLAIQGILLGGASAATAANPTAVIGIALAFIATIILIYSMFRLLLRLINNYLTIIVLTITAPFQFLAASLPGRQGIATDWILSMLANVLAFPAVLAVFYFIAFILGKEFGPLNVFKNEANAIQIAGSTTFPLFGGIDLEFIKILLAFGALVALPAIPDIIARTIGKVSQAGQLIGQEIGSGVGQGQKYYGQFQSGLGGASGQIAQARGLFGTPAYMPTGFDEQGKPTGWTMNPMSYQPDVTQKFQARQAARTGGLAPYKINR